MKQLSLFDFLDEVQSQCNTQTTGFSEKQSNLSSNITASKVASEDEVAAKVEHVSPLMQQWCAIKEQYPDALLLFRVGDFYEAYNEDAIQASKILGITLARRGRAEFKFCGFPFHALDAYLPRLVRAGKRIAICDELTEVKKNTNNKYKQIS